MKINYISVNKCRICGSTNLEKELEIKDFDTDLGSYGLLVCHDCGMYYTSPYPDSLTLPELYRERASKNFDIDNSQFFSSLKDYLMKRDLKRFLSSYRSIPESFVDIGAGNGRAVCMFRKIEPCADVVAVDFAEDPPERLNHAEFSSIKYMQTNIFLGNDNNKFDLIMLRHVLEHVEHPLEFINTISRKLTERGMLVIEVPNIKSGLCRVFPKWSPSYYPPYHLVHFTESNLEKLLVRTGLDFDLSQAEMPLMSNLLANMCHCKLNNVFRFVGMILHPAQLLVNSMYSEKSVLVAVLRKK